MVRALPYLAATLFLSACSSNDTSLDTSESNSFIGSGSNALTTANVAIAGTGHVKGTVLSDASITLRTTAEGCRNSGGPFITIEGELKLAGFDVNVVLQNNLQGTHETDEFSASLVPIITPDKGTIVLSKNRQNSGENVGGNPLIALQLEDAHGSPIGAVINLGRCTRLRSSTTVIASLLNDLDMSVDTGNCSGAGGPYVNITGALALGAIKGKLLFFKNPAADVPSATPDVTVSVALLPDKLPLPFPKQPPLGGAGGNPLVCVEVPAGDSRLCLGRCNQL
jgi:hypothetical protein